MDQPPVPSHIWLLSVKGGKARQLTRGSTSVLETAPPIGGGISAPSWSADGHWIVYTRQADANDSDSDRTTVVAVDVATGEERPVTHQLTYEYVPQFAPKGDEVAYLYLHGPGAVSDCRFVRRLRERWRNSRRHCRSGQEPAPGLFLAAGRQRCCDEGPTIM